MQQASDDTPDETEVWLNRAVQWLNTQHDALPCPDPTARDWAESLPAIRGALEELEALVDGQAALEALGEQSRERITAALYSTTLQLIVTAQLAGVRVSRDLQPVLQLWAADSEDRAFALLAFDDMTDLSHLQRVLWLLNHDQERTAHKVLKDVLGVVKTEGPVLERLRALKNMPQPIDNPPTMFTLNGIGTGLYGSRDRIEDTYVATLAFCVLFIPLIPLASYRVRKAGGNSYQFFAKVPLSSFAIWARRVVLASIALGIGAVMLDVV